MINKTKLIYFGVEVLVFIMINLLANKVLEKEYLFKWVAHNWKFYLFLCAIALFLMIFNKRIISILMTVGITIGIFVGNFLGSAIKIINEGKIIEGMSAEEVYRAQHHPGFEIWIGTILLSIVVGITIQFIFKNQNNLNN